MDTGQLKSELADLTSSAISELRARVHNAEIKDLVAVISSTSRATKELIQAEAAEKKLTESSQEDSHTSAGPKLSMAAQKYVARTRTGHSVP